MSFNSSYSPSSLVEWLHDGPRFGKTNDITTVVDRPGEPSSEEYWEGVGSVAVIHIVVGIVFFLLFLFLYCCACCKCCCFKKRDTHQTLDSKEELSPNNRTCRKFAFFVVAALLVCASIASAVIVSSIVSGMSDTVDGITGTLDIIEDIETDNDAILAAMTAGQGFATNLDTTLSNADSAELLATVNNALTEAQDLDSTLGDSTADLDDIKKNSDDGEDRVMLTGAIYVAVVGVWAILVLVSLTACKHCMCIFKTLMFVALPLVLLTWVFTGFMFAIATVSADVCIDPDNIIVELSDASPTAPSTSIEASVYYYIYCDANPSLAPSGLTELVDEASAEAAQARVDLADIPTNPSTQADVNGLIAQLDITDAALVNIQSSVSCDSINGKYRVIRTSLCNDTVDPYIQLWGIQLVSCVLLIVAVFIAIPFWNHRHVTKAEQQAHVLQNINASSPQQPHTGAGIQMT